MARELRTPNYTTKTEDRLNFLGGKRLRRTEEPLQVALKKVDQETGGKLSHQVKENMKKPPLVHFSSSSKYVLYLVEVESDCDVDIRCAGLRRDGVKRLEWVSRTDLYSTAFVSNEVR